MRRPPRTLVLLIALPFFAGCFGVTQTAVPSSLPERQELDLHGVVVTSPDTGEEEVIRFAELHDATWTASALSFVADVRQDGRTETLTRLVPITELEGVLVRRLDAGKTSAIMGALIVGTAAAIALLVTGEGRSYDPS